MPASDTNIDKILSYKSKHVLRNKQNNLQFENLIILIF